MHSNKGSFESIVEGLILRVSNREISNQFEAFAKIGVPKLVTSGQGFEGTLIDNEAFAERSVGSRNQVAPP